MWIQTVYKPEENVDFIRDWLNHHLAIGIEHFYLYDNGGSHDYPPDPYWHIAKNTNKYGAPIKYTVEEARDIQADIVREFPVTIIPWQNRDRNGKLLYAQPQSIVHFKNMVRSGLCAFIDMDEFIIKKEDFKVCRMKQRKFKARHFYNSVHECHEVFDLDTTRWAPKVILDMANFPHFDSTRHDIHFQHLVLPETTTYFNHYNHTEAAHCYLLEHMLPEWGLTGIERDYTKAFHRIDDTGLLQSSVPKSI